MNYEFTRNENDKPTAQFDMGGEVFSRWFSEELGDDTNKISALLATIQQLDSGEIQTFSLKGLEIDLLLDRDEVSARSKDIDIAAPDEIPEGTELYDEEYLSGCGLEDFKKVLLSWQEFISRGQVT